MRRMGKVWVLRQKSLWGIAAMILVFAIFIKLLAISGIDDGFNKILSRLASSPTWAEKAIKSETISSVTETEEDHAKGWLNVLCAQSSILKSVETVQNTPEVEVETEDYIPWKLVVPKAEEPKKVDSKELPIKSISINPTSSSGYVNLGKIYLKNDSTKKIDLNWLLKANLPFELKGNGPHVLIVHTHASESYFPAGKNTYTPDDVERTLDKRYNVVRVGDEIEKILKSKGISVIHNRNIYDSPSYTGCYTRTLSAITEQMKKAPGIKVILDIHRDSMTTKSGVKYKTSATVNGKPSAQMMLVMSTGESGLPHPNWVENLKLGVKLQCQLANKYPGLMRPINLRKERFNMHVTTGSLLIEVGSSANTLEEALTAVKPLSEELAAILKTVKK